jgi:hypothetical protein
MVSILPIIYEQLWRQNSFEKELQCQTVIRELVRKTLSYKKADRKMLVKLTATMMMILQKVRSKKQETFAFFSRSRS